jgi:hypothetical protein
MVNVDLSKSCVQVERPHSRPARRWTVYALCAVAGAGYLLTGCGGARSLNASTSVKQQRAIVVANQVCAQYNARVDAGGSPTSASQVGAYSQRFVVQRKTELARLRAVMSASSRLPGAAGYLSHINEEYAWLEALATDLKVGHVPFSQSFADRSRRIYLKLVSDEKALGLTACIARSSRRGISSSESFQAG